MSEFIQISKAPELPPDDWKNIITNFSQEAEQFGGKLSIEPSLSDDPMRPCIATFPNEQAAERFLNFANHANMCLRFPVIVSPNPIIYSKRLALE